MARPSTMREDKASGKNNTHATRACNGCRKKKARCVIVEGDGRCKKCISADEICSISGAPDHRRPVPRSYVQSLEHSLREKETRIAEKEGRITALLAHIAYYGIPPPTSPLSLMGPTLFHGSPIDPPYVGKSIEADPTEAEMASLTFRTGRLVLEDDNLRHYGATSIFVNLPAPWPSLVNQNGSDIGIAPNDSNPAFHRDDWGCDFEWSRYLPLHIVPLTLQQHDTLLDLFYKFFASWGYRGISEFFRRDMSIVLSLPSSAPLPKLSHYSPMLHNAILAVATAYSDDPELRRPEARRAFAQRAKEYFEDEGHNPNLSVIQALAHLAAFHSGMAEQLMGSLYFGMCARMAQALGIGIDSSICVTSGRLTPEEHRDRTWIFWAIFTYDKFWSFYVGRDVSVRIPPADFGLPDMFQHSDPGIVFQETVKLFTVATEILEVIYGNKAITRESMTDLLYKLDSWYHQLPDAVCIKRPKKIAIASPQTIMLHLAYHWLEALMHRPFYRSCCNPCPSASYMKLSVKRCDDAADSIVQLLDCFKRLHGLRYAPITANQICFTAGTIYLLAAVEYAEIPSKRRAALNGVRTCIEHLLEIGQTWNCALKTAHILRDLLQEQLSPMESSPKHSELPLVVEPPSEVVSRSQSPIIHDPSSLSPPIPIPRRRSQTIEEPHFDSFGSNNDAPLSTPALTETESVANGSNNDLFPDFTSPLLFDFDPVPDIPQELPPPSSPWLHETYYPMFHQFFTPHTSVQQPLDQEFQQPWIPMPFASDSYNNAGSSTTNAPPPPAPELLVHVQEARPFTNDFPALTVKDSDMATTDQTQFSDQHQGHFPSRQGGFHSGGSPSWYQEYPWEGGT